MPFDEAGFPPWREPPRRSNNNDTVAVVIILVLAFCLLLMPISIGACVDVVRYLRGG